MSLRKSSDSTDDLALLLNTLAQAKYMPYSLEQIARVIGLYVNSDKAELMCFNQDSVISIKW